MDTLRRLIGSSLLIVAAACACAERADNRLPGVRLAKPPAVDGTIAPGEWDGVPVGTDFQDQDTGAPSPEATRFRLAYDADFVYFAAEMDDSAPSRIQATQYKTNVGLGGDDKIELRLDTFGTNVNYNRFAINPRGATQLALAGGRAMKREWSGEFSAAARVTESGWVAEARIPWRLMLLPRGGVRTLRINLERTIARMGRDFHWRFTGNGHREDAGYWTDVEIPNVPMDRSLKLLPYGYAGVDPDGAIANLGLDLKAKITDQLDAAATINPDFRNVENQILSLDFSYFERLAGESRPFFQEGGDYFGGGGMGPRIFASQRIRRFDAGVKAFGQVTGRTRVGVLDTVDFGVQNALSATVAHRFSDKTGIGIEVADLSQPNLKNRALALRADHLIGATTLYFTRMQSDDSEFGGGYRTNAGLSYFRSNDSVYVDWSEVSPYFVPRLGFSPETNFRGVSVGARRLRNFDSGRIQSYQLGLNAGEYRTFGGDPYSRSVSASGGLAFWRGVDVSLNARASEFMGNRDRTVGMQLGYPRGDGARRFELGFASGRLGGGDFAKAGASAFLRPNSRWVLSASYERQRHFGDRYQAILASSYDLGDDRSISGRLVQRGGSTNVYLSLRRSGNRGVEYYVIVGDPNAPTFRSSLIVKVVAPLEVRF
ncbi:MAG: hypothetical protein KIS66_10440 [Fimbriimonadaceae bacterium]|nr:hypothetical protein [Fimbriimonadaceae bacterium]